MKALKYLLYFLIGLALLVVLLGLFGKKRYHIERSVLIKAPHSIIKEKVTQWAHFPKWSPWQDLDPNLVTNISGTDGTVGAMYTWKGNDKVGAGSLTFRQITDTLVNVDISFSEPWTTNAPATIRMQQVPEGVQTTWGVDMHMPFPWNGFAMFTDVERSVGKDYADGLQRLKALCEGEAQRIEQAAQSVQLTDWPKTTYAALRKQIPMSQIEAFFGEGMKILMGGIPEDQIAGQPGALYFAWDEANQQTDMAVVLPVKKPISKLTTGQAIQTVTLAGKAASLVHTGPSSDAMYAHYGMDKYLNNSGLIPKEPVLEVYLNLPTTEPDSTKLQTQIVYFYNPKPEAQK